MSRTRIVAIAAVTLIVAVGLTCVLAVGGLWLLGGRYSDAQISSVVIICALGSYLPIALWGRRLRRKRAEVPNAPDS